MNIGMLWYDNDPKKSTVQKISEAVEYYEKKYGLKPRICEVNAGVFSKDLKVEGIRIVSERLILPGHYFIGTGE
jgi:hypothetical protein